MRGGPEAMPLRSPRLWFTAVLLAALALLPPIALALSQPYYLTLVTRVMIYAIAAASLNLLIGYAGLVSLGHAMYLSLGAYAAAIAAFHGFGNGWLQLAAAVLAAATLAAATGLVSLRTRGMAFIMITLAFAQMWLYGVASLRTYGGDDGLRIARRALLPPFDLNEPLQLYAVTFAVLLVTLYGTWRLVHSRFGHALRGIRSNARRMRGSGWPVMSLELSAMVLAACVTAVAGFLLANLTAYASPAYGAWNVSGELIVMVVAGGMGTVVGPLVGAVVLLLAEEALSGSGHPWLAEHWAFVIGAAIVLLVAGSRRGLYGLVVQWDRRAAAPSQRPTGGQPQTPRATPPQTPADALAQPPASAAAREAPDPPPAAGEPMLRIDALAKRFGGIVATDRLSLAVPAGELHALIGPNGAGKSTVIGQLCGEIAPDGGRIALAGRDITGLGIARRARLGLARCHQITQLCGDASARENVMLSRLGGTGFVDPWRPMHDDAALRDDAAALLEQVGLAARIDVPAAELAHGEQRQLELAMAMARRPSLLLLDEPLAGMSSAESATMVALLAALKGQVTMLLVEHDMDAVFTLADRITVLVDGRAIATGTPDDVRADPAVRDAYLGDEQ
ncbi:MAG TPA: ATP-binding cassette domain-containing protein [Burkholderiaceae bacterium]|nr:ATP-binding cassette domain-containing protein [Burkholderiaceae bacterium]